VYDYEVSEPFGEWCRHSVLKTGYIDRKEATAALMGLVYEFFMQLGCDEQTSKNLSAALEAVRQHWLETHTS
jgi:hypothetical protein